MGRISSRSQVEERLSQNSLRHNTLLNAYTSDDPFEAHSIIQGNFHLDCTIFVSFWEQDILCLGHFTFTSYPYVN